MTQALSRIAASFLEQRSDLDYLQSMDIPNEARPAWTESIVKEGGHSGSAQINTVPEGQYPTFRRMAILLLRQGMPDGLYWSKETLQTIPAFGSRRTLPPPPGPADTKEPPVRAKRKRRSNSSQPAIDTSPPPPSNPVLYAIQEEEHDLSQTSAYSTTTTTLEESTTGLMRDDVAMRQDYDEQALSVSDYMAQPSTSRRIYGIQQIRPIQKPESTKVQDMLISLLIDTASLSMHAFLFFLSLLFVIVGIPVEIQPKVWIPSVALVKRLTSELVQIQMDFVRQLIPQTKKQREAAALQGTELIPLQIPFEDRLAFASQTLAVHIYHSSLPSQFQVLRNMCFSALSHTQENKKWAEWASQAPMRQILWSLHYLKEHDVHLKLGYIVQAVFDAVLLGVDTYRQEASATKP
ncbi:hypothetical protein ACI68E_003053 [Malassezia pachydermatis]|uniref:Uncharacterized protein n=1 Tax=Malassezia pachydermatis TaxID=77020 RepID=A0A0M9VPB4_9BASI|nr:hypothetical protein Malapachy_3877 [Malassezia pachydermatis]KOS14259.1 hypothetical protein Malapachy_3877 [Malassezia pachydermatis]